MSKVPKNLHRCSSNFIVQFHKRNPHWDVNKRNIFAIFSYITHTILNAGKLRKPTHINVTFDDFNINYKSASPKKSNIINIAKMDYFFR